MTRIGEVATCPWCGREFRATSRNQKYCDPACSIEATKVNARRNRMKYYRTHKEQEKRYQQLRHGGDIKPLEPDEAAEQAVASLSAVQRECLRFLFMPARRITIDGEEW